MYVDACVCHCGSTSDGTLLASRCQVRAGAYQAPATKEYGNEAGDKWIISCITRFSLPMYLVTPPHTHTPLGHSWSRGCDSQRPLPPLQFCYLYPLSSHSRQLMCLLLTAHTSYMEILHVLKSAGVSERVSNREKERERLRNCLEKLKCSVRSEWADLRNLTLIWWLKLPLNVCVHLYICVSVYSYRCICLYIAPAPTSCPQHLRGSQHANYFQRIWLHVGKSCTCSCSSPIGFSLLRGVCQ